jgi:RNase P subunit RPR2
MGRPRNSKRKLSDVHISKEESVENRCKRQSLNIQKNAYLTVPQGTIYLSPEYIKYLKETYSRKSYFGIANCTCKYCGALFWPQESLKHTIKYKEKELVYTNCCKEGKIVIPPFKEPPKLLSNLLKYNGDNRSKHFLHKIRQYNSLFAFTSMGANIDKSINHGEGPYIFCINGQVHHRIGCLLPRPNNTPKFAELYIYDAENEISNIIHALQNDQNDIDHIDPTIAKDLMEMLDVHNPLVKKFCFARDLIKENNSIDISIRMIGADKGDPIQYEMPTADDLALLVVGDLTLDNYKRDIIVYKKDHGLQEISILHPALLALQYPLLFPYGERGYQLGINYHNISDTKKRTKVTMHEFFKYHVHYRSSQPNPYLCYGRLSKQIIVDCRALEDEDMLQFIAKNQNKLRVEYLQGITDAIEKGLIQGDQIGKKVILPSSHTGCKRYMIQNYHDGIAICRVYGPPDLFILSRVILNGQRLN